jgi:hypothetical protein
VAMAAWALGRGDAREQSGRSRGLAYEAIGGAPVRYRDGLTEAQ